MKLHRYHGEMVAIEGVALGEMVRTEDVPQLRNSPIHFTVKAIGVVDLTGAMPLIGISSEDIAGEVFGHFRFELSIYRFEDGKDLAFLISKKPVPLDPLTHVERAKFGDRVKASLGGYVVNKIDRVQVAPDLTLEQVDLLLPQNPSNPIIMTRDPDLVTGDYLRTVAVDGYLIDGNFLGVPSAVLTQYGARVVVVDRAPMPTLTPEPTVIGLPAVTPDGPSDPGRREEPAPVESVAIEVTVSDPRQADLVLVTGLPNACYSFGTYDLTRDEDTIRVRVTNVRPDNPALMCAEVYRMVTTRIPLGPHIEPCAIYQVIANGKSFSVQAIGPNIRCRDSSAGPGAQVEVAIGETVPIGSDGLSLTFLEVSEDSRCPSDVVCVWAGRSTISVNIRRDGSSLGDFGLTLGEGAAAPVVEREGYRIRLTALEPYPISTRPTSSDQYLAILTVSKG